MRLGVDGGVHPEPGGSEVRLRGERVGLKPGRLGVQEGVGVTFAFAGVGVRPEAGAV